MVTSISIQQPSDSTFQRVNSNQGSRGSTIAVLAKRIFDGFYVVFSFPCRFLGSKTWSVPGVILRAPWILFKRLFVRNSTPIIQELFPNNYRFSFEKTLTREEVKPYYPHVAATAFVHQNKDQFIPSGWKNLSPKDLGITMLKVDVGNDCLYDLSSGFKASLIEKDDEIIVAFGSLEIDSGKTETGKFRFSKSGNILTSLVGLTPKPLQQAASFVQILRNHTYCQGKKISVTGNSYGAALAAYAGLKNETPAVCFNAFQLGVGSQWDIGKDRLEKADQYITHISAKGDYVTDLSIYKPVDLFLSAVGLKTPGNFGRRFTIPSAYKKPLATHGFILGSVLEHLGYNQRTTPAELKTI